MFESVPKLGPVQSYASTHCGHTNQGHNRCPLSCILTAISELLLHAFTGDRVTDLVDLYQPIDLARTRNSLLRSLQTSFLVVSDLLYSLPFARYLELKHQTPSLALLATVSIWLLQSTKNSSGFDRFRSYRVRASPQASHSDFAAYTCKKVLPDHGKSKKQLQRAGFEPATPCYLHDSDGKQICYHCTNDAFAEWRDVESNKIYRKITSPSQRRPSIMLSHHTLFG